MTNAAHTVWLTPRTRFSIITYNNRGTMTYSARVQPQPPGEIIVQLSNGGCVIANNLGLIRIGKIVRNQCQVRE